jgi:hypothetical protein
MKPSQIFDLLRTWTFCLFTPLECVSRMLVKFRQDGSYSGVFKIWSATITLSIIINYPLLHWFGIEWNNFGYYLPEEMVVVLSLLINGVLCHVILLIAKVGSALPQTMILYTIPMVYTPITTLFAIPLEYRYYSRMHLLKLAGELDPGEVFQRALSHGLLGEVRSLVLELQDSDLTTLAIYVTTFIGILTLATFAECITLFYRGPRFRIYLSVAIATYISNIMYQWVEFPVHSAILYIFIR